MPSPYIVYLDFICNHLLFLRSATADAFNSAYTLSVNIRLICVHPCAIGVEPGGPCSVLRPPFFHHALIPSH